MFVSVIRKGCNSIFECKRVHIRPDLANDGQMLVDMEDGDINMVIEKKTTQVFVMNSEGRTIDTYRWS